MHIVVARYAWQLISRLPSKLGIGHTVRLIIFSLVLVVKIMCSALKLRI